MGEESTDQPGIGDLGGTTGDQRGKKSMWTGVLGIEDQGWGGTGDLRGDEDQEYGKGTRREGPGVQRGRPGEQGRDPGG